MVAPNGARKSKVDHPALPLTLDEIVATAVECQAAGADGLHLHLRDADGRHILDADQYLAALGALKSAVPDMLVQITTEAVGQYTAVQQRAIVVQTKPQSVSISLGEMLADGDTQTATAFYADCVQSDIAVQHILYGAPDLNMMSRLLDAGNFGVNALQLLFVLGRYSADQQSAPEDLDPFLEWVTETCPDADWAVCAFGQRETECLTHALNKGGKVRVGFENSFWNADGTMAKSNAERVTEVIKAIR